MSASIPIPVSVTLIIKTCGAGVGGRNRDLAILRGKFDRVLEQVPNDLLKFGRVALT